MHSAYAEKICINYAEFRAKINAFSDRVGEHEKSTHSGGRGVTINEIFDRRRNAPDYNGS